MTAEMLSELASFTFDITAYQKDEIVSFWKLMFADLGFVDAFSIEEETLDSFLSAVRANYNDNPFHNLYHAFCVSQMVYCVLKRFPEGQDNGGGESPELSMLERFGLFVAAICHDLDHPGLSNSYLINSRLPLAMLYNDISCLENHHCSQGFAIMSSPPCNILHHLSVDEYKQIRRQIVRLILATDMANHFATVASFKRKKQDANWSDPDMHLLLSQIILMSCDISNEVRSFDVAHKWASNLQAEFANQVALEKSVGLPVLPHMDPDLSSLDKSQIGFISNILRPIWVELASVLPVVQPFVDSISENLELWQTYNPDDWQPSHPNQGGETTTTDNADVDSDADDDVDDVDD